MGGFARDDTSTLVSHGVTLRFYSGVKLLGERR